MSIWLRPLRNFVFPGCLVLLMAPAMPQPSLPVYAVTYVDVLASSAPRAATLLEAYRAASRQEAGASSVEVYSQEGRASGFAVVEVWRDAAAFEAHGRAAAIERLRRELEPLRLAPVDVRVHSAYDLGSPMAPSRHATTLLVHVDVLPPHLAEYERIVARYLEGTRRETGLLRLDILQTPAPHTNHFTVIESWLDAQALQAHQKAATAQTYREELAPMLGALYDERTYRKLD